MIIYFDVQQNYEYRREEPKTCQRLEFDRAHNTSRISLGFRYHSQNTKSNNTGSEFGIPMTTCH